VGLTAPIPKCMWISISEVALSLSGYVLQQVTFLFSQCESRVSAAL